MTVKVASLAVYNPAGDIQGRGARLGLDMAVAIVEGSQSKKKMNDDSSPGKKSGLV
jgi:hypothetical protein